MPTTEEVAADVEKLQEAMKTLQQKLIDMEEEKKDMLKIINGHQANVANKSTEKSRFRTTNSKAFTMLHRYNGDLKSFDQWKYKFRRFLETERSALGRYVAWAESLKLEEEITDASITKWGVDKEILDVDELGVEIYNALALNVEDTPLSQVRNLEDDEKGIAIKWRGA